MTANKVLSLYSRDLRPSIVFDTQCYPLPKFISFQSMFRQFLVCIEHSPHSPGLQLDSDDTGRCFELAEHRLSFHVCTRKLGEL